MTETPPASTAVTLVTATSTAAGAGTQPVEIPSGTTAPVTVPTAGSNKGLTVPSGLLGAAVIAGLAAMF